MPKTLNLAYSIHGSSAKVVADSISPGNIRLTTLQLRYPRMIHAEAKTHRRVAGWKGEILEIVDDISLMDDPNLSRNGRSSRAVPVQRLLEEDPYIPQFMANGKGMQATEPMNPENLRAATMLWSEFANQTKDFVRQLAKLNVHKQHANRPLEWFGYIDVLVTADSTQWPNFFGLRDHEAAQPEIQDLARCMKMALEKSTPKQLLPGDWHMPYVFEDEERDPVADWLMARWPESFNSAAVEDALLKLSVARCARLSIEPFDGDASYDKEFARFDLLVGSSPVHASPAEHQATPDEGVPDIGNSFKWAHPEEHGNLRGWRQFRKLIPNERITS